MSSVTVATQSGATPRPSLQSVLLPLNTGPGEIASVDGLRAVAALGVMMFHAYYLVTRTVVIGGLDVTFLWNYGQSGVHLFFILSGFLLFTPFARAMLTGRPLPSVNRFFQRRALRILPAYWACLAILAALQFRQFTSPAGLANIGMHLLMLHDVVPSMDRAIEGPFWTLAVEAQFYVMLPIFAWAIARFVGPTRSRMRLILGVLAVMAGALALRGVDAFVQSQLLRAPGSLGVASLVFLRVTLGTQGKYLEVFALGMLCSVLYLAAQDESRRLRRRLPEIGLALASVALVALIGLARIEMSLDILTPHNFIYAPAVNLLLIFGPLIAGISYACLTLGVLWSPAWLRGIFEAWPLRFIGLISYSLYLWHEPILSFAAQYTAALPPTLRVGCEILVGFGVAVPVAYLSYQLIERPFLSQRRRLAAQAT